MAARSTSSALSGSRGSGPAPSNFGLAARVGPALALGLVAAWVIWWAASIRRDVLVMGQAAWFPSMPFLAGDFKVHIDHVARLQLAGIDPYRRPGDWVCALYPYPPMIGRCFEWVGLFDPSTAARVWLVALGLILSAGALGAWRTRRELGIGTLPPALIVAAVLFSTPALYALERGQVDPLVLVPMMAAAWLLRRRGGWAQVAAGALLGLAAWLKYYPALAAVALVTFRRWRALAALVAVAGLIGLVDFEGFRASVKHATLTQSLMANPTSSIHPVKHSIVEGWGTLSFVRVCPPLRSIPGSVVAAVLVGPAVMLVGRKIARSSCPGPVLLPYMLWLTSAATFCLPYSNDYNLATLPIAALAVWDRKDRPAVHLALALSILWSQPFGLPVSGEFLLVVKLGALFATGASLSSRAIALSPEEGSKDLARPAFARRWGLNARRVKVGAGPGPDSRRS